MGAAASASCRRHAFGRTKPRAADGAHRRCCATSMGTREAAPVTPEACCLHDASEACCLHDASEACCSHDASEACCSHDVSEACCSHDVSEACCSHDVSEGRKCGSIYARRLSMACWSAPNAALLSSGARS